MRTTIIIGDALLDRARKATGIKKASLVRTGQEALISREAGKRRALLGDSSVWIAHFREGSPQWLAS